MNVVGGFYFNKNLFFSQNILLLGFFLLVSCVEPPGTVTEELIKINPPSFSGSTSQNFTTPTPHYILWGDCDPRSYGIEYSYDQTTWITVPGGCQNGQFNLSLTVNAYKKIYARAKSKMGYTQAAYAMVRLALPPTTAAYQAVVAGSSVFEGDPGVPFTMGHAFTGERLSSAGFHLDSSLTGVVYGEP